MTTLHAAIQKHNETKQKCTTNANQMQHCVQNNSAAEIMIEGTNRN